MYLRISLITLAFVSPFVSSARENIGDPHHRIQRTEKLSAADCNPASSSIDLNINNVRALLQNGGDMWWDLNNTAHYEVPKVEPGSGQTAVSSLFAGAIWVGGYDAGGQLKIAAQTYRQNGNDYFPGPLDAATGTVDKTVCDEFDHHWQVFGSEIDDFLTQWNNGGGVINPNQIAQNILNWPAKNNPYNPIAGNRDLAPFSDVDGNGYYDPTGGDYPVIDPSCGNNYADQMIWWVYNDKGNIHTETGGEAIGIEVHALAFSFKTNDVLNDMTFYRYSLLNRATSSLDSTFMSQWIDADLGCYLDDYVGCDTTRGLGIVYNQTAVDGGSGCSADYGDQPPMLGIDYFKGPKDQNGTELKMSRFSYYSNDFSPTGNPEVASHYYGYMSGTWKDGTPYTEGGNGHGGTTPTHFLFPSSPDDPSGWSQCTGGTTGQDPRFMISSGPFRFDPGASNEIVIGVPWVRPPKGTYPCPKFTLLQKADDKAQALFDNCFAILEGPPAPDVEVVEMDKELVLALDNTSEIETYQIKDPTISAQGYADSLYRFQGYKIYQVQNSQVTTQELNDASKARLIAQVDLKDNVTKLINYNYDPILESDVPELMVDGNNAGIKHTFQVLTDAFATGDNRLVNHKTYYFTVISYAYNGYTDTAGNILQKQPYLEGRKNIKVYSAIPHIVSPEDFGMTLNSKYGDGPVLTRQEGSGNGGQYDILTDDAVKNILAGNSLHPSYAGAWGPVSVKVYDPKKVPVGNFEVGILDSASLPSGFPIGKDSAYWYIKNLTDGTTLYADRNINQNNEQLFPDWGMSVYIEQVGYPGPNTIDGGFLGSDITYSDPTKQWLGGIADQEGQSQLNWIRAGDFNPSNAQQQQYADYWVTNPNENDKNENFEKVLNRTWAPWKYVLRDKNYSPNSTDPAAQQAQNVMSIKNLISVDVVLTSDKSKWSRCVVLETGGDANMSEGNANKLDPRKHNSVDQNGVDDGTGTGMGWFPGYAINPETGERLNIMFGEDSWLTGENGNDMIFNPTSNLSSPTFQVLLGGRHFIYVHNTPYDGCAAIRTQLTPDGTGAIPVANKRDFLSKMAWTTMSYLATGETLLPVSEGLVPSDVSIHIRVSRPYEMFSTDVHTNGDRPRYTFSTADIGVDVSNQTTAMNALDTINVVPNPYYAYSAYEVSQLDNRVKIVNLPQTCTITILSVDGNIVRKVERDDPTITSWDWDLKNDAGIPIASGVYIIHIQAEFPDGSTGEKTIKFFGVMRPIDLDSF